MAWTDFSNTASDDWTVSIFRTSDVTGFTLDSSAPPTDSIVLPDTFGIVSISSLAETYNIPGFEDGYQPASTPDPIANNIDEGGGGGSTRPSSGLLYPRGTS